MTARLTVHTSPDALGAAVASSILAGIERANESRSRFLLGAPTGRTPRPILAARYNAVGMECRALGAEGLGGNAGMLVLNRTT